MNDSALAFWGSRCKRQARIGPVWAGFSLALLALFGMAAQSAEASTESVESVHVPDAGRPDPQHKHLGYRSPVTEGLRLTVDGPGTFVHLAWDPNANFGSQNMWRLSTGWRF